MTVATGGGGAALTVTADVPLLLSLLAVIVALPTAAAVTKPLTFTTATPVLELLHVTCRPESAFPLASFSVAVSCDVAPTWIVGADGDTVTVATGTGGGAVTVSAAEPLRPPAAAEIIDVPGVSAAILPSFPTVATLALELDQLTVRFDNVAPVLSFNVAVATVVAPAAIDAWEIVTVTEATGLLPFAAGSVLALEQALARTSTPATAEMTVRMEMRSPEISSFGGPTGVAVRSIALALAS